MRRRPDDHQAHHPLPGREGRPGGEGGQLPGPGGRFQPGEAGGILFKVRRGRAGVLRHHRLRRGPRAVHRHPAGGGLQGLHPADRWWRHQHRERLRPGAELRRGQGVRELRGHPKPRPDPRGGQALRQPVRGDLGGREARGRRVPRVRQGRARGHRHGGHLVDQALRR